MISAEYMFHISCVIRTLHISVRYKPQAKIIEILHIWIDICCIGIYSPGISAAGETLKP